MCMISEVNGISTLFRPEHASGHLLTVNGVQYSLEEYWDLNPGVWSPE